MSSGSPCLEENLWGYGRRLRFVDEAMRANFPGRQRREISVLDVGCGNGSQLAIPLAGAGYQLTAIDPHAGSIQTGRRLAPSLNFIHGSIKSLAPANIPSGGKFDCVVIAEVLEHLAEPEDLLRSALALLAHSGIVIVTVPNGFGEFELDRRIYQGLRIDRLVGWLRSGAKQLAGSDDESPHVQCFTDSRLRRMFAGTGLRVLKTRGTSFVSGPLIAHSIGKFRSFVRLNASVADYLPLAMVSGWMFALKREED